MEIEKTLFFGQIDIETKYLFSQEQKVFRKELDEIKNSIEKEGLLNPLEITLTLENGTLGISKGNRRIIVLKELGFKKVPCNLRVFIGKEYSQIAEGLKKLLPFLGEQQGIDISFPYKYKEWEGDFKKF